MVVRFDESIEVLVEVISQNLDIKLINDLVILRDASGRLSSIINEDVEVDKISALEQEVRRRLGGYARSDTVVRGRDAVGAQRLIEEAAQIASSNVKGVAVRLLDRRFVGPDWLCPPAASVKRVPRIAFASLKGGVGRSTALSVIAAHLSRLGFRVLCIDFDLEAPGLGAMLLSEDELPPYGTLDYLVENGLSGIDSTFIADLAGDSYLGAEGARVAVVPAIGKVTYDNPRGALEKIARAYLELPSSDGLPTSLTDQFRSMVERFEATGAYDVVLIDARAGLHETTPAAILGLGAEVLLFGIDQPQTFLGYRLLMAHLARFSVDPEDDWRERLNFVHAKASADEDGREEAKEKFSALYDLIDPQRKDVGKGHVEPLTASDFEVEWDDSASTEEIESGFVCPEILHVLDDAHYRDFDPLSNRFLLSSKASAVTFENLLSYVEDVVTDFKPGAKK